MTNPAGVRRQLVGVFSSPAARKMADVFDQLNVARVCIVHAADGMDEVSLGSATDVWQVGNGSAATYQLSAEELGLPARSCTELRGGTAAENAGICLRVLGGEPGAHRDVVVANAAVALTVAGRAASPREGVAMAAASIDSGRAMEKLRLLQNGRA